MSDLKQRRGGHKRTVTIKIKELDSLLQSTSLDFLRIKVVLNNLKRQRDSILNYDEQIQLTITDDELDREVDEANQVWEDIESSIMKAEYVLSKTQTVKISTTNSRVVKLPKLELPKFSGNVLEWSHFWDRFESAVHAQIDLTPVEKFSYLKGQLSGDALDEIRGYTINNDNYIEAIDQLKKKFGDPEKIIQMHLDGIIDLHAPSANMSSLNQFRTSYESHLRSLKALNANVEDAGYVFVRILFRKLPSKTRDNISRAERTTYWNLVTFRAALDEEIKRMESIEPKEKITKEVKENHFTSQNAYGIEQQPNSTTGNFVINTYAPSKICKLCNGGHFVTDCTQYKDGFSRLNKVKELNLCTNCMRNDHSIKTCTSTSTCRYCNRYHHSATCFQRFPSPKDVVKKESSTENVECLTAAAVQSKTCVALPVAIIPLESYDGTFRNHTTMFDQCAQRSLMLEGAAEQLKILFRKKIVIAIDGFDTKGNEKTYELVRFVSKCGSSFLDIEAILVKTLPSRLHMPGITKLSDELRHRGFKMAEIKTDSMENISLLIGADQYYKFIYGHTKVDNIHLIKSKFGDMISGPFQCNDSSTEEAVAAITIMHISAHDDLQETMASLDADLQKLWRMDAVGISQNEELDKNHVLRQFENSVTYENKKYFVRLPWRPNHPNLNHNFGMARGRLKSTLEKLRGNPHKLQHYNKVICEQIDRGFIERVDCPFEFSDKKIHYLSHHSVIKDSPTTPLRVVFDCSSGKPSLNSCLYAGPSLMHELTEILLRFRIHRYACISDIEKAFLMIQLHEDDRDATRFLWTTDPLDENGDLVVYRFKVVLFGATCSQFMLNATVRYHLNKIDSAMSKLIQRNLYIDNLQGMNDSEEELLQFYRESKQIMSMASLNLRGWITNSPTVQYEAEKQGDGGMSKNGFANILGMRWKIDDDVLTYPELKVEEINFTKRAILKFSSRIFDPLGWLTPVTIRSRIFLQKIWKLKYDWDEQISSELQEEWRKIASDLQLLSSVVLKRQLIISKKLQIHAFSDASGKAYGTVVYFVQDEKTMLVMSKSRVAPLKTLTIPQMELAACTLSARLVHYILNAYSEEIVVQKIILWTDSQVALRWITDRKVHTCFIQNRIDEIQRLLPVAEWHYVKSTDNPSDLLSRGMKAASFLDSKFWFTGPKWLNQPEKWPNNQIIEDSSPIVSDEICVCICEDNEDSAFFDIVKFSDINKVYRITRFVLRYIANCRKLTTNVLELQENSESYWIKCVQAHNYRKEIEFLSSDAKSSPPNLVKQLRLQLHNGILRSAGRLENSNLNYAAKYPILLPPNDHFTKLIVRNAHYELRHEGISGTVNFLRQYWWIPKIRQQVKSIITKCVPCRKLHAKSYNVPISPPLPSIRVSQARPFSVTGVDYTGELRVKERGQQIKVYIALFTCAVTRAVHLELVYDNTAESFINAFRRFVSRRACPRIMISDNAKNFISSSVQLQKIQEHAITQEIMAKKKFEWRFIPSRAAWYGGMWERLIGLTKNQLKKSLGKAFISAEELRTILTEVEANLNNRPLTYASGEKDDPLPLTPSELLHGYRILPFPSTIEEEDEFTLTRPILTKRQNHCSKIKDKFWSRWKNEYLSSLRERHTHQSRMGSSGISTPKIGDVVIVHEDCLRSKWKLGRIVELIEGRDGFARSARLKSMSGIISRPIAKLFPLEVSSSPTLDSEIEDQKEAPCGKKLVSTREAAKKARRLIRQQLNFLISN